MVDTGFCSIGQVILLLVCDGWEDFLVFEEIGDGNELETLKRLGEGKLGIFLMRCVMEDQMGEGVS